MRLGLEGGEKPIQKGGRIEAGEVLLQILLQRKEREDRCPAGKGSKIGELSENP